MRTKPFVIVMAVAVVLIMHTAVASASEKIDAPIREVTVYNNQAQVTRIAQLDLDAGEHALLIENLPVLVSDASLRASAYGVEGITFLGLNHCKVPHLEAPWEKVAELESQIWTAERQEKQAILDRLDALTSQKIMLKEITKWAGGELTGEAKRGMTDVSQWDEAYTFIGRRLREVNDSIRLANAELSHVENRLDVLNSQVKSIRTGPQRESKTVQIDLSLEKAGHVELKLEYMIQGAFWKPIYDARLADAGDTVELDCFAWVGQRTGEDWEDVELTLSTATPSKEVGPGDFSPWLLSVTSLPRARALTTKVVKVTARKDALMMPATSSAASSADYSPMVNAVAVVDAGAYVTTFKVKRKESVPSGEEAVRTPIANWKLGADANLICRPRNREGAYRLVTITNGDQAPLMPGESAIFAGLDFLGNAQINELIVPGQKFELPFGLDNELKVEREMLSHKKTKETKKWRIDQTIRIKLVNNGKTVKTIRLEEPLPVSQDNRAKVKLHDIEPEPSETDVKGKAVWTFSLAPGEIKTILIAYRIEYPTNVRVSIL